MRRWARLVAVLLTVAAAGCSAPSWMPLAGKPKAPEPAPPPPPPTESRAPILSRPALPPDSESVVDRVICVINSDAVTLYELDEAEAFYLYENKMQPPPDAERTALREKVLNSIVEKRLQLQQAEKEKLVVEDSEMKEQLDEIQKKLGATTQAQFEEQVKAQGLTYEGMKKRLYDQLMIQRIIRRSAGGATKREGVPGIGQTDPEDHPRPNTSARRSSPVSRAGMQRRWASRIVCGTRGMPGRAVVRRSFSLRVSNG